MSPKKNGSKGKIPAEQPAKKQKQKQLDLCVVVFSNGKCELFQSEDEARIQQQSLPEGVVNAFKLFPNVRQANSFIKLTQSNDAKAKHVEGSPNIATKEDVIDDVKIPAVTPESKTNHKTFLKSITSSGQNKTSRFGITGNPSVPAGNTIRSKFLASISQTAHCVNTMLRVFVIKFDTEHQELPAGYTVPEKQVVVLDVFDQTKNATFWTHKPKTWFNMFRTAEQTDKNLFDGECYLLNYFQFRDLDSKHKSEPKFYEYKNTYGGTIKIPVEALYALVPLSWTTKNILEFTVKIGNNLMKSHAKEAYELFYPTASANFKASIDSVTGEYWKTIEAVFDFQNITIIKKEALSEIFSNEVVLQIMSEIFQDNRQPEDWNDELRMMYAFKNLLDDE